MKPPRFSLSRLWPTPAGITTTSPALNVTFAPLIAAEADIGLARDAAEHLVAGHVKMPIVEDAVDPVAAPVVSRKERLAAGRRLQVRRQRMPVEDERQSVVRNLAVRREAKVSTSGSMRSLLLTGVDPV